MGLDQYASIQIVVPEDKLAKFPPIMIQKLNTVLLDLKQDQSDRPDQIEISNPLNPLIFNTDFEINNTLNPHDNQYLIPLFKIEYQHDNYLDYNYWDLNQYILSINEPQLKPADEDKIGTEYIRDANDFINGEYNLDITDNIEKIIEWLPNEETTVKRKLTRLYTYQQKLQHVIDQYPTNLKAIVTYRIWY